MIELLKLLIVLVCLKFIHIFSFYSNGLALFLLLLACCLVKLNPIKLIFKLKYFLLSIFIIYPLSIPGEIIINVMNLNFTKEGIISGSEQCVKLLNFFLLAKLYLITTSSYSVINSLMYFIYPLKLFSLNVRRLHKVMILTFTYFENFSKKRFNFKEPIMSLKKLLENKTQIKIRYTKFSVNPMGYFFIFLYIGSLILL